MVAAAYPRDTIGQRMAELGYSTPMPPAIGSLPAGSGKWALPHYQTFNSIATQASRSYLQAFDEALRDSRQNALAMRRDFVIDGAMRKLLGPIACQEWQLTPDRPDDPRLIEDADRLTKILKRCPRPGFHQIIRMLGESRFYGRYGVQFLFRWEHRYTQCDHAIKAFEPVNGDKIVFRYDGQPGIMINPFEFKGDWVATDRGSCHFLDDRELEQFLWCEFNPEDADWYESQFAGQLHGVGFRSKLYWPWWLREQIVQQTLRFLRRAANGYTVGFYDGNNVAAEARLAAKLRAYTGDDFLLFPRDRSEHTPYGIEHQPIPLHGSNIFLELVRWINEVIVDYILQEDLTSSGENLGLGSNQSDSHERTADIRTRFHSADIQVALQPLIDTLARYNCSGRPAPRFEFLNEKRNPVEYMEALDFAYQHGLAVAEDDVRDVLGLPAPREGQAVLAAMVPGQPAGIGGTPMGMPQSMPAGPGMGMGMGQDPSMMQGGMQFSRRSRPVVFDRRDPNWRSPRRRPKFDHFIRGGKLYFGQVA